MQVPLEYPYPPLHELHFPVVFIQFPEHVDGHVVQDDAPPSEYLPSAQVVQEDAAEPLYVPAAHELQLVDPVEEAYVPAVQALQLV